MKLVIVRHGKAEHDSVTGSDKDRKLTAFGERQGLWLGESLLTAGFEGCMVLSSGAERAITTAMLLCQGLGGEPQRVEPLMLGSPTAGLLPMIERYSTQHQLIFVGHNPPMSELTSLLVSGFGHCSVELRTGAAAIVDLPELAKAGSGRLLDILRLDK
jgi:phosphohistidine phosphatase